MLVVLSLTAGLLTAATVLPFVGIAGIASRNAARTFNALPVAGLGQLPARSELLDSRGHLIAYYYPRNIYRVPVSYSQIAPVMRNAIIAIEDARFYQHGAFDLHGTDTCSGQHAVGQPGAGRLDPGTAVRQERMHPDGEQPEAGSRLLGPDRRQEGQGTADRRQRACRG